MARPTMALLGSDRREAKKKARNRLVACLTECNVRPVGLYELAALAKQTKSGEHGRQQEAGGSGLRDHAEITTIAGVRVEERTARGIKVKVYADFQHNSPVGVFEIIEGQSGGELYDGCGIGTNGQERSGQRVTAQLHLAGEDLRSRPADTVLEDGQNSR